MSYNRCHFEWTECYGEYGLQAWQLSSMLKMGMAGFGFLGSAYATLQSVEDGNAQQAGFRFILTAVSGMGLKRAMGEGMTTINSNCFIAGTLVLTENGKKPIEEIQAGDFVYSTNPETGESEYKEVVQVFENEANELVHLTVNGEEIVTTPKHPFYVPQRGWISAIDLKAGDILVLSNGEYVIVEQVQHEILETPVKVYNFEVEDFHTYYVGENSVLVHNLGCGSNNSGKTVSNDVSGGNRSGNSNKPKGWKLGDPIDSLTRAGNYPSWSTVKSRYWKNKAFYNPDLYSDRNLNFMKKGKAPHYNETTLDVPQELHHINGRKIDNPHNINNLVEVWPWQHADIDPFRHYNGPRP